MAKYTQVQIDRSLKKLARKLRETNEVDFTGQRWSVLFEAAWAVIKKTGHKKEYDRRGDELIRGR